MTVSRLARGLCKFLEPIGRTGRPAEQPFSNGTAALHLEHYAGAAISHHFPPAAVALGRTVNELLPFAFRCSDAAHISHADRLAAQASVEQLQRQLQAFHDLRLFSIPGVHPNGRLPLVPPGQRWRDANAWPDIDRAVAELGGPARKPREELE